MKLLLKSSLWGAALLMGFFIITMIYPIILMPTNAQSESLFKIMIPELGFFALIFGLCMSLVQAFSPFIRFLGNEGAWIKFVKSTSVAQFGFILLAALILIYLLLTNDFTVIYVINNSARNLPVLYKICALWSSNEGSMLLWTLVLSGWIAFVALFEKNLSAHFLAKVLSILGIISTLFIFYIVYFLNPFERIFTYSEKGTGLNPLLQDFGLAIHPPILYIGYVGFAIIFAITITALIEGEFEKSVQKCLQKYNLLSWGFLSLGIILGAWWAYRVLGWGGWWNWDPVENLSLLPWLAGLALIHSIMVSQKTGSFKLWSIFLALIVFPLSFFGTFLTRSGMLVSSHSFAEGLTSSVIYMLVFLLFLLLGTFFLFMLKALKIHSKEVHSVFSKEAMLLLGSLLIFILLIMIALGTIYPLFIDILQYGKISVGAPYFNLMIIPFSIPLLIFLGIAPFISWKKNTLKEIAKLCWSDFVLALIISGIVFIILKYSFLVFIGNLIGVYILIASIRAIIKKTIMMKLPIGKSILQLGGIIAHLGMAILTIGIIINVNLGTVKEVNLKIGNSIDIGNSHIIFKDVYNLKGPNYTGVIGEFVSMKENKVTAIFKPEIRSFQSQGYAQSIPALSSDLIGDTYIALGNSLSNNRWSVRLYYEPFIKWIWAGGLIIALGGFISYLNSRKLKKDR